VLLIGYSLVSKLQCHRESFTTQFFTKAEKITKKDVGKQHFLAPRLMREKQTGLFGNEQSKTYAGTNKIYLLELKQITVNNR
jgi:hypothetical protein